MQNYEALAEALAKFTGYAGPLCPHIFNACRFHRLLLLGKFESYVRFRQENIIKSMNGIMAMTQEDKENL